MQAEGRGDALYGYAGGQTGTAGLWYFGNGYFDPQTGQFIATGETPLAANILANPGALLFGLLILINWRRRKKRRLHPATLLFFGMMLAVTLTACKNGVPPPSTALPPEGIPITTPTPNGPVTFIVTPTSDGSGVVVTIPPAPTCTAEATGTPPSGDTAAPTLEPSPIENPTTTAYL